MTEGGGACILAARKHPDKPYTVGRPALGYDIRLIDDHGVEVAPGQSGEAVVGVPFQRCGETPVAFVLPRSAIGKILKRELRVAYPAQDPQP